MNTRERCAKCGAEDIERHYYIWRQENIENDLEAFDIQGAEPTDMGNDWWCPHCEEHPDTEEYVVLELMI